MWFRMPNHTSFVRVQLGYNGLGHTDGKVLMLSFSEKVFGEGGRGGVAHGTPVSLDSMLGIASDENFREQKSVLCWVPAS